MNLRTLILWIAVSIWSSVGLAIASLEECRLLLANVVMYYEATGQIPVAATLDGKRHILVPANMYPGDDKRLVDGRFVDLPRIRWYEPNAIYINISNHPREGTFHFSLVAGDLRMDSSYGHTKVRRGEGGRPPYSTKGVVFKINTDADTAKKVRESILAREGRSSANCIKPVLEILEENGLELEATYRANGYASPTRASANLLFGNVSQGGKKLPVSILATSWDEYRHFFERSVVADRVNVDELSREAP